jgi:protein O-GlcNAc transferase
MNEILMRDAMGAHRAGNFAEAARLCRDVLRASPQNFPALHLLGYLYSRSGQFEEAARLLGEAVRINPQPDVIYNRGCALQALNRHEEALACFRRVSEQKPEFLDAAINSGIALLALRRFQEALSCFDAVLARKPEDAEVWNNRGNALLELGREPEALGCFDTSLAKNEGDANAWCNRGVALQRLNRHEEALVSFDRALALSPGLPSVFSNRGVSLLGLRRLQEAYADFQRAEALQPEAVEPVINSGSILLAQGRLEEAAAHYGRILERHPDNLDALRNRANTLVFQQKFEEAVRDCEALLARDPEHPYMKGILAHNRLRCCDWRGYGEFASDIVAGLGQDRRIVPPFESLALTRRDSEQLAASRIFSRYFSSDNAKAAHPPLWKGERYRHDRIRIAYLSADFHNHAVAGVAAGLFESHAKTRFEITGVSLAAKKPDAMRARLEAAFEHLLDVETASDFEVAKMLREREIDIAVDLMGYTGECRPGILSHRPAPVQVNYLGFAGTMGTDHIDYILADSVVVPDAQRAFYSEAVVHLPDSFMPFDSRRPMPGRPPDRVAAGLPAEGFVFCSFNNTYKYTPPLFDIWMRLLHSVRESVLWLPAGNAAARRNLKAQAGQRGIAAERVIFAPFEASGEAHLNRLGLADLFLDTLPFNAHSSAADALWAGVPVLTAKGESFAGRVAASLLTAAGLPELIADTLKEYEARALHFARDGAALARVKERLAAARVAAPLFDTSRHTRHLEAGFESMWERQQRGLPPEGFAVPAFVAATASGSE